MTVEQLIKVLSNYSKEDMVFIEHESKDEEGVYIMEYVLGARYESNMVILFGG